MAFAETFKALSDPVRRDPAASEKRENVSRRDRRTF